MTDMRWTPKRKAEVVALIRSGGATIEQISDAVDVPVDEISLWIARATEGGTEALKVTERWRA